MNMKSIALLACVFALAASAVAEVNLFGPSLTTVENDWGYVPLANTAAKLKRGGKFTVAVVGDSIGYGQYVGDVRVLGVTYGCRALANSKGMPKGNPMGYARTFTDHFKSVARARYGLADKDVDVFYAVWGGATTKSTFGYFCDDIVARRPDLVLLQIWNDCPETAAYAESILRTLWKNAPETDVILFGVGNVMSNSKYTKPLQAKYGVPHVDAHRYANGWLELFGQVHHNDLGVVYPDGRIRGSRGFFYGNGAPHVNDESYAYWCTLLFRDFATLLDAAAKDTKGVRPVVPAAVVDAAPMTAKGLPCLYSHIVTPAEMSEKATGWRLSVREVPDEPSDTPDRAGANWIVASEKGATFALPLRGSFAAFRGANGISVSTDGKTFAPVKGEIVFNADADADVTLTFRAEKKDASLCEFYLYGHDFRPVAKRPGKHRWSVRYHAKVAPLHVHDWQIGGRQVVPTPLVWVNVFRDETYTKPLAVADESVIHRDCERNGDFLGWVEADEVRWDGGRRIPVVKTQDGKRIYKPGEALEMEKIGRDLDLVAAFSKGALPTDYSRTVKASFVSENSMRGRTLALLDAPAAKPVITLPSAPTRHLYRFNGWKKVNGKDIFKAGASYTLDADTEFEADWTLDEKNAAGVRMDGGAVVVDFTVRSEKLEDMFNSMMNGRRMGSYKSAADGKLAFHGHAHDMLVSSAKLPSGGNALRVEARGGAYWQFPECFGPASVPVKLGDVKTVTVKYAYSSSNAQNLVGQHMTLHLNARTAEGLDYARVSVKSSEPIAVCEEGTMTFDVAGASSKHLADGSLISDVSIQFYDIGGNMRPAKNPLAFNKGDVLLIGEYTFRK